jgi:hypothetical protein
MDKPILYIGQEFEVWNKLLYGNVLFAAKLFREYRDAGIHMLDSR